MPVLNIWSGGRNGGLCQTMHACVQHVTCHMSLINTVLWPWLPVLKKLVLSVCFDVMRTIEDCAALCAVL